MKTSPKALWDETLALVRKNVSEQQYNTWFKPLVFKKYDEAKNTLLLHVPSPFVYEYLEENFTDLLGKALTHFFGRGVRLAYHVPVAPGKGGSTTISSENAPDIDGHKKSITGANVSPSILDAAQPQELESHLNPHQTFNNFIEGVSNKLPRAVGLSIADDNAGRLQFNPLFVFGPSGCGKTHLINAIGVRVKEREPHARVLYISARLFQVQYSNAMLKGAINDFINFYQTIDVLIVDDIQEWMTATGTQNTFFHIFNHLFRNGKRIILASDRPPIDLKGMNERLLTRFACGLIAELEKPDEQLCIDILHNKMAMDGLNDIPEDVVRYIARVANNSVRDLEGVVNSLLAYSVVYNSRVDMNLAERVIKRAVKVDNKPLTIDDIIDSVCSHYNVTPTAVRVESAIWSPPDRFPCIWHRSILV